MSWDFGWYLGENIILLTLGGSHAYGIDKEGSDVDIRGIALNTKPEILLGNDFDDVVDVPTDTTIYSFNKMLQLLSSNNRFLGENCIIVQKMYEKCRKMQKNVIVIFRHTWSNIEWMQEFEFCTKENMRFESHSNQLTYC